MGVHQIVAGLGDILISSVACMESLSKIYIYIIKILLHATANMLNREAQSAVRISPIESAKQDVMVTYKTEDIPRWWDKQSLDGIVIPARRLRHGTNRIARVKVFHNSTTKAEK